jgi:hypothetical protein
MSQTVEGTVPTVNDTSAPAFDAGTVVSSASDFDPTVVFDGLTVDYNAVKKAIESPATFADGSPVEEPFFVPVPEQKESSQEDLDAVEAEREIAEATLGEASIYDPDVVSRAEFEELQDAVRTFAEGLKGILEDLVVLDQLEARIEVFNKNSAHKL